MIGGAVIVDTIMALYTLPAGGMSRGIGRCREVGGWKVWKVVPPFPLGEGGDPGHASRKIFEKKMDPLRRILSCFNPHQKNALNNVYQGVYWY